MNTAGDGAKKKQKQFSLQENVDLLREIYTGKKQSDLFRERGIAPLAVATIWKDREKILKILKILGHNLRLRGNSCAWSRCRPSCADLV
ncbi:hypothetical protein HPB50_021429 [Hyalomma asiaticum]|uniref:Uncharacterized protein n=1 Tax=Hyalomma asiaticum TaxID=266040 RepID=A0ACB7TNR6_HYAAI|nr:hypothetical protein HPB50_021429 [Hyalomma asiaticum]